MDIRNLTKWTLCWTKHRGHAWVDTKSDLLTWRRCLRCELADVSGPMGRLWTFDPEGTFDPINRTPPPRST